MIDKQTRKRIDEWLAKNSRHVSTDGGANYYKAVPLSMLDSFLNGITGEKVPHDTEQENSMEFTKEDAKSFKQRFTKFIGTTAGLRFDMASVELLKLEYFNWLDAHTEREFPCPGCGEEMNVLADAVLGIWAYHNCNEEIVRRIETARFDTKQELSEALNDCRQ